MIEPIVSIVFALNFLSCIVSVPTFWRISVINGIKSLKYSPKSLRITEQTECNKLSTSFWSGSYFCYMPFVNKTTRDWSNGLVYLLINSLQSGASSSLLLSASSPNSPYTKFNTAEVAWVYIFIRGSFTIRFISTGRTSAWYLIWALGAKSVKIIPIALKPAYLTLVFGS